MSKVMDTMLNALAALAGLLLVALMLLTVVKVGMRVVFNHGIVGADQISGVLMVYITFFAAAWVLRQDGHVTIDIVTGALPGPAQRVIGIIASLVAAAACLALAWYSGQAVATSIRRGIVVAAELEIPRAVNIIAIPFGSFLLGIEFIRRALRFARDDQLTRDTPRMEA